MLLSLFSWIDTYPWAYLTGGFATLGLLLVTIGAAFVPPADRGFRRLASSRVLFFLAVLFTFSAFRWPAFFAGRMQNPDEAQWIAGALTLREGGLPWKNLDCHTSGPLTPCALLLTAPLGLPLDYLGARVLATLFQILALLAVYDVARRHTSERIARLAMLPAVPVWALSPFHDLLQFSSEHTPVLLLALGAWTADAGLFRRAHRGALTLLATAGVLIGAACFAKPQALLLQGALLGLVVTALWLPRPVAAEKPSRLSATLALLGGALIPMAVFVGYISLFGLWGQIQQFFWESNAYYAGHREYPLRSALEGIFHLAIEAPCVTPAVLGAIGFCLAGVVTAWNGHREGRVRMIGSWLLLAIGLATVAAPGRFFTHYLHFLVLPLCAFTAAHLESISRAFVAKDTATNDWRPAYLALGFAASVLAWPLWQRSAFADIPDGPLAGWQKRQKSPIGERILADVRPGDHLVVWGWAPEYHVETGLPQGAREAHSAFMLADTPLQGRYRWRMLFDLRRNRPRWFVDAVTYGAFAYSDQKNYGHDAWPELRDFIAHDYDLLAVLKGVRIYRRKN